MTKKIFLSIIIPAFNESERIAKTIRETVDFLNCQKFQYEIIIIDDNSTDKTSIIAEKNLKKAQSYKIIKRKKKRGKGFAVKRGFKESSGRYSRDVDVQ